MLPLAMTKALEHRHPEVLGAQHRASKGVSRNLGAASFEGRYRGRLRMRERRTPFTGLSSDRTTSPGSVVSPIRP